MIRTVFWQDVKDPSRLVGFDVKGHADFGEAGHDLLCAAVSGIVTAALNTFQEATDFGDRVQIRCNEGDVSLRVEQSLETVQQTVCQTLLLGLQINMEQLEKKYPDHIGVEYRRSL